MWTLATGLWLMLLVSTPAGAACEIGRTGEGLFAPLPEGFVPDSGASPATPGYTRIVRFELQPERRLGTAVFARLAGDTGAGVYQGEKRRHVLLIRFDDGLHLLKRQSYLSERPDDLWIRDAAAKRVSRVQPQPTLGDFPRDLCESLTAAGIEPRVEIRGASDGAVTSKSKLARLLDPDPGATKRRLIRGR